MVRVKNTQFIQVCWRKMILGFLWHIHFNVFDITVMALPCRSFWAHLCNLHGGLICIALCEPVCLGWRLDTCWLLLTGNLLGQGSLGSRSPGSGSEVTSVKPSLGLKVMILAGGLASTSSCFIFSNLYICMRLNLWTNSTWPFYFTQVTCISNKLYIRIFEHYKYSFL